MNVTEAARAWSDYKRRLAALGPEPKAAAEVLKQWFRAHPDKPTYKGIAYAFSTHVGLNLDTVRSELTAKQLARCEEPRTRETLSLLERQAPKPAAKKPPAKKAS